MCEVYDIVMIVYDMSESTSEYCDVVGDISVRYDYKIIWIFSYFFMQLNWEFLRYDGYVNMNIEYV